MDMLCIAAEAQPTGYVLVNGRTPTTTDLARLTGAPEADVQSALAELDAAGVFSRDRKGRIYNRRMVRDSKMAIIHRKNGKKGGNPSLSNTERKSRGVNPPDNLKDKPLSPYPYPYTEESSDSSGAASPAPAEPEPVRELFDRGLRVLGGKGRSLLGKMRKQYGDVAVAEAIVACEDEQPSDPAAFFVRCLSRAPPRVNGHHQSPATSLFEGAYRAAESFIERHQGSLRADSQADEPLLDSSGPGGGSAGPTRRLAGRRG